MDLHATNSGGSSRTLITWATTGRILHKAHLLLVQVDTCLYYPMFFALLDLGWNLALLAAPNCVHCDPSKE
jgi:hypothetical protein